MAWRRSGDKPLSEALMVSLPTHICVTQPQWVNFNGVLNKPLLKLGQGSAINSTVLRGNDFLLIPQSGCGSIYSVLVKEGRDDVIKWKHFPRYWPFVRGIHRSPVNSLHKGQWSEALMFSLICTRINGWANNGDAGDLRRHLAHYDVIVMISRIPHWHRNHPVGKLWKILVISSGAKPQRCSNRVHRFVLQVP